MLAVMASGAHALALTAPALAEQDRQSREAAAAAERAVITHAPTAASDGLPVPALAGGIVLAFAVGITAGKVHRRRLTARRQSVARERPAPVPAAPARPAPPPPEPAAQIEPQPIEAPPVPAAPPPPPPEPWTEPPRVVAPPSAPAPPPPEPPRREAPETERPTEPLRLVSQGPKPRPQPDAPLSEAPEVPQAQQPSAAPTDAAAPLTDAPEALRTPPPAEPPEAAVPGRRFARVAPWPQEAEQLWTCEIGWKPGYRKSSFRAMAGPPGAGKRRPIGDSPAVRWTLMGDPEPPTPELAVRVRALVNALEASGWQHIGRGEHWYAQRFVWRAGGEPQPVTVPDVAEPAER